MKRVFVISPFGGDSGRNADAARTICCALVAAGHAPFASHLFYPGLGLDDRDPEQRECGTAAGRAWLAAADVAFVFVWKRDGVTDGMVGDIAHAHSMRVPVVLIDSHESLLRAIEDLEEGRQPTSSEPGASGGANAEADAR